MITFLKTTTRGAFTVTVEYHEAVTLNGNEVMFETIELAAMHIAAAEALREALVTLVQGSQLSSEPSGTVQ